MVTQNDPDRAVSSPVILWHNRKLTIISFIATVLGKWRKHQRWIWKKWPSLLCMVLIFFPLSSFLSLNCADPSLNQRCYYFKFHTSDSGVFLLFLFLFSLSSWLLLHYFFNVFYCLEDSSYQECFIVVEMLSDQNWTQKQEFPPGVIVQFSVVHQCTKRAHSLHMFMCHDPPYSASDWVIILTPTLSLCHSSCVLLTNPTNRGNEYQSIRGRVDFAISTISSISLKVPHTDRRPAGLVQLAIQTQ